VCLLLWLEALANCGGVLDAQPCYVLAMDKEGNWAIRALATSMI